MPRVVMYTSTICWYCRRAKALLDDKGVGFEEINLDDHPELRDDVIRRSGGRRTVPQIFIGERAVGGYRELKALDDRGELDPLLQ